MTIALAQSRVSGGTGAGSLAYSAALTNPSLLWVAVASFQAATPTIAVDDAGGHTWTAVAAQQDGFSVHLRSWTAPNTGTSTPTVNYSGGDFFAIVLAEFTGVDATTPLDGVSPVSASGTATPAASGSITPGTSNAWVVGAMTVAAVGSDPTITEQLTLIQERELWNTDMTIAAERTLVATPAATNAQWTIGGSISGWLAHAFVLRDGGAPPPALSRSFDRYGRRPALFKPGNAR